MPMATNGTRTKIQVLRELSDPSPVRPNHVPPWLCRRLFAAYGPCYGRRGSNLLAHLRQRVSWLDHCGSTRLPDGRVAFVSEPYSVSADDLRSIAEIAALLNCEWWVTANSWWYPGHTLRIVLAQPVGTASEADEVNRLIEQAVLADGENLTP